MDTSRPNLETSLALQRDELPNRTRASQHNCCSERLTHTGGTTSTVSVCLVRSVTALSVLVGSPLLLGMISGLRLAGLFLPAVGCALLACCWLCSSRLLLAVLFCVLTRLCHFVQLSEILVDLLLVVVQVLRLCAPFRQSGFASFFDFVAVILSLFSVFWRRLHQHYSVVVYCSEVRLKHLQRHYSVCATS